MPKRTRWATYVHVDAIDTLDPDLQQRYEDALETYMDQDCDHCKNRGVFGGSTYPEPCQECMDRMDGPEHNVVKIPHSKPQVSFLLYPDFHSAETPHLAQSVIVYEDGKIKRIRYQHESKAFCSPILHKKELLL